ncbi:cytochrome P450 [Dothidotthia symphoricarpi CBS 119687]|uniref:Cytochrome P450 n=1 Tax=Dothidotthia symphoricarpi CBS 119687 TaxID=1392245 RepID=A0A6A6AR55_9PLEO|nr:cytochrome P450 [Dothidotthia symphoricarpi CBS 119687]KAF2132991.1 cytochrome P450 [Dothidotthia symphoricarpi CBS 119687]
MAVAEEFVPTWSGSLLCYFRHALCVVLLAVVADYVWMLQTRWKMPPGPFPWPIVGNTFSLPEVKPWYLMEQLSKDYASPVITFWIGRKPTVWINDAWAADEILVKRAGTYCSRPHNLIFAELGSGQWNMLNMYTITRKQRERFRDLRKLTHHGVVFDIQQVQQYRGFQDDESKVATYDLLKAPNDYVAHFERYATSVVSIIGFGRRVADLQDPMITEVIAIMHNAAELAVLAKDFPRLMETLPWLAKFPNWMAPWKHGLGQGRNPKHSRGDFFYALAEEANEYDEENYSKFLFREMDKYKLHPLEVSGLTGNLLGAGADTTASTLITAILAMRAFPEVLLPAWEELDRVVGRARSPDFKDDLPYMRAFVKEVLRWRSVAIIGGMPHAPTQDDYWNGYLIPKGCWVQGNVWAIHHNAREFPEPDRFNPQRYLDTEDARPFPGEKGYMTFGWGRRSCAGQYLAEQGTYVSICRLVWAFRVNPALDEKTGQYIPVDIFDYSNGSNWRPNPFRVVFEPRDEQIKKVIIQEGEQALDELAKYDGQTKYQFSTFYT